MNFKEYQDQATSKLVIKDKSMAALLHRSLGLTGEAGELANIIKKIIRDKQGAVGEGDIQKITEKLGDTLYYLAVLAEYYGVDLEEIAAKNLQKAKELSRLRQ